MNQYFCSSGYINGCWAPYPSIISHKNDNMTIIPRRFGNKTPIIKYNIK
jgi:hypothetical protein